MSPKKAIIKSESSNEVVVAETVTKSRGKKASKTENVEDIVEKQPIIKNEVIENTKKSKTKVDDIDVEPKKTKGKVEKTVKSKSTDIEKTVKSKSTDIEELKRVKIPEIEESKKVKTPDVEESKKVKSKKIIEPEVNVIDNVEYNTLKVEWGLLCEKIKEANKEKELLEIQKNQLLNKLWKLGETSYPKTDIFETNEKVKPPVRLSTIQTKILNNDSSDDSDDNSDDSDDSDSDDSESEIVKPKKSSTKKAVKSDSDTSDSDSDN